MDNGNKDPMQELTHAGAGSFENDDPLLNQCLTFLASDIENHPNNLYAVNTNFVQHIQSLTSGVEVILDQALQRPVLYLDYDGVLHPSDVWMIDNQPVLQFKDDPSLTLFCWAPILEEILAGVDKAGQIKIVLSTTWAHRFGFERASEHLPESLKSRVIGVTEGFPVPRLTQITVHAEDNQISRWIAIDDDFSATEKHQDKLIRCSGSLGISSIKVQQELRGKLEVLLA